MHPDLHTLSQRLQLIQLCLSIEILKKEYFENKPNSVPTGQIVLQNNLPFVYDIIPIVASTKSENPIAV
jgi:hypothetical protein